MLSIEEVPVCNFDELVITLTPSSLVCSEGIVWVSFLAIFTNDFRIIKLVVNQEVFWVVVNVDVNLSQSIMKSLLLDSLIVSSFKPLLEHLELALLLKFINELWDWANPN